MDEPNQQKGIVEKSVQQLMTDLPLPLQDFLHSPQRDAISLSLSRKYNLHADQAGSFEEAYLLMLLGVFTPNEFIDSLKGDGVPEATIQGLIEDVNELVFKPLQKKVRETEPAAPSTATTPSLTSLPTSQDIPPQPLVPSVGPGYTLATGTVPSPAVPQASVITSTPPVHPSMRTMATDMQAVKEHRVPEPIHERSAPAPISHIAPPPMPAPRPTYVPSAPPVPYTPPAPAASVPPTPTPILPPPLVPLQSMPETPVVQRTAAPPANLPQVPQPNQYPIDPYREAPQ